MDRIDLLDLRLLGFFYAPPLGIEEEQMGYHRKNQRYLKEKLLAPLAESPALKIQLFEELERMGGYFPNQPEGSYANLFVCRAAAELASYWDVPVLVKMLFWPEILNHWDTSYIFALLDGIEKKGCAEDEEGLRAFCREIEDLARFCYREGDGDELIKLPGMVRLLERVKGIIDKCLERGSRGLSEAARIEAGAPAAAPGSKDFLWERAGGD